MRRGLALRKRDVTLMSEAEAEACAALLAGESNPVVEVFPNLSVLEVLRLEVGGRSLWGDTQEVDEDSQSQSIRLFVCLVVELATYWLLFSFNI